MAWCGRRDSNPHDLRHWNLNPARLPIPPRPPATFRPSVMADRLSHRKTAKLSGKPRPPCAPGASGRALGAHISVAVRSNQGELAPRRASGPAHAGPGRLSDRTENGRRPKRRGSAANSWGGEVVDPHGGVVHKSRGIGGRDRGLPLYKKR